MFADAKRLYTRDGFHLLMALNLERYSMVLLFNYFSEHRKAPVILCLLALNLIF